MKADRAGPFGGLTGIAILLTFIGPLTGTSRVYQSRETPQGQGIARSRRPEKERAGSIRAPPHPLTALDIRALYIDTKFSIQMYRVNILDSCHDY